MEKQIDPDAEKIKFIQDVLEVRLKKGTSKTVFFDFSESSLMQFLGGRTDFEELLKRIDTQSGGEITWKERIDQPLIPKTTAGDTDLTPRFFSPMPIGFDVHVKDPSKLKTYFEEAPRELEGRSAAQGVHRFPFKLPAGTTWENITIQFLESTKVLILVGKYRHETNYADMGFSDGRGYKPNQQWTFLRVLAQRGGEITWEDPEATSKWKKTKELLSKSLREYFTSDYDPFLPYRLIDDTKKRQVL